MRSIFVVIATLMVAVSLGACGAHNGANDGTYAPSLSKDNPAETSAPSSCPEGEILFASKCRKQRGIIIDQRPGIDQHPEVLGIIIDQKGKVPPPPPPPQWPSSLEMDSPTER